MKPSTFPGLLFTSSRGFLIMMIYILLDKLIAYFGVVSSQYWIHLHATKRFLTEHTTLRVPFTFRVAICLAAKMSFV